MESFLSLFMGQYAHYDQKTFHNEKLSIKNISIRTGELHGDVDLGICHYFTLPFLPGHPRPEKLRLPERSAASSASTAFR